MGEVIGKQNTLGKNTLENLRVLFALMSQGGKSDRVVAKTLGINNTTLSRRKKKLEKEGYIKEYTLLPDFYKMGLEIIVFSFASTTDAIPPENSKHLQELPQKYPEMICVLEDQDAAGTNWFTISVHRNYDEFIEMYKEVQKGLASLNHVPRVESKRLIFHTNKLGPKAFSLRNLESLLFQPKPLDPVSDRRQGRKTTNINT